MAEKKRTGSVKRFGSRYGRTIRDKVGKIENLQRKLHKCPFCSKVKVKRLSAGIWQCKKCSAKFIGRAYTPGKVKGDTSTFSSDEISEKKVEQEGTIEE